MTDAQPDQPIEHAELSAEEAERLRREWDVPEEEWQAALDRHRAKEEQRAKEIFGARERFAIPDADSDT
jgi:hypothetical protein